MASPVSVAADSAASVPVSPRLPALSGLARPFRVELKAGLVLRATHISARYPLLGHSYLLVDGQQRVVLTEVDSYENETGSYRRA